MVKMAGLVKVTEVENRKGEVAEGLTLPPKGPRMEE
jgi:hypothetical protein